MHDHARTISEVHAQFRSGELTPHELLERCLARIDARESAVQAWVSVDHEGARRLAEQQTLALSALGNQLPALFGVPVGVKDIVDVAGWPTQAGSTLRAEHRAERDAPVVARLRAAGAIILGKTVTTQFASFDPSVTRNPWNLGRTPGGSSSGSAAAVASGMCVAAIGTQTGGSIVRPASYCGVVGFKPSYGAVPLEGVVPLSPSIDHVGTIARNVPDAARLFGAISNEQTTAPVNGDKSLKLGVLRDFFCDAAEPESRAIFDAVLVHLENALGEIDDVQLGGDIAEVHAAHRIVMSFECAAYHRNDFAKRPDAYGPFISQLIQDGLATSPVTYAAALDLAIEFRHRALAVLAQYDALLMPATHGPAPDIATTGDPRWQNVWSFARLPAITIPCGFASLNLPLGFQLVAADDAQLLSIAATCEETLDLGDEIERLMG